MQTFFFAFIGKDHISFPTNAFSRSSHKTFSLHFQCYTFSQYLRFFSTICCLYEEAADVLYVFLSTTLSNRDLFSAKHSNMAYFFNSSFLMEKKFTYLFSLQYNFPRIHKMKLHAGKYLVLFPLLFWAPDDIDLHK